MKRMENNEKKIKKVKYDLSNFKDVKIEQDPIKEEERFIPKNLEVSLLFNRNDIETLYNKAAEKKMTLVQYISRQLFRPEDIRK